MVDRLISADALKAALQGLYQVAGWEKRDIHFSLSDMECNIDYIPTIEAEPIKHGCWVYIRDEENNGLYECSECHKGDIHAKTCKVPYCWNCGAKMDESGEDPSHPFAESVMMGERKDEVEE